MDAYDFSGDGGDGGGDGGDAEEVHFDGGGVPSPDAAFEAAMAALTAPSAGAGGRGARPAATIVESAQAAQMALDEEDVELMRNFGDHALMERVQAALTKQLSDQLDRVEAELREAEEAREKSKKAREDAGLELYGIQQQLARVQVTLDGTTNNVAALQDIRRKAEGELALFQEGFASRKVAVETEERNLDKFKGEMDGISDTLRQVERYNEEVEAEIALTRRAASKAESDLSDKEKGKVRQDMYIDNLTTQIKRLTDSVNVVDAQVAAQRAETAQAVGTLAEAATEVAAIETEKKQLLQQWQGSVLAMRRRDEALTAMHAATRTQQESLDSMDAEETNLRKAILASQDEHAKKVETLDREASALTYLESTAAGVMRQAEALEQRAVALSGTIDATEAEIARVTAEAGRLEKALRDADRERALIDKTRFGLEDQVANMLSTKTTNEQAARALLKDARRLVARVHEVELAAAEMENSVATSKVQVLDANNRLAALREQQAAAEKDVADKSSLIGRYESEIKSRLDAIDKKMAVVDSLNRKYERLVAAQPEAEHMGPLHAQVHNLQKSIASSREAIEALQKRWLADQTALVSAANDSEVKSTRLRELSSQVVLLDQKRIRLDASIEAQTTEQRRLRAAIKTMHEDMARISALIAKNSTLSGKLAAATSAAETAFGEELRMMEKDAAVAESKLVSLRDEKERLMQELMECERQVVLWEKKITLERETQEALDPTVGAAEIAAMEKEIHRMRIRLAAAKSEQEKLVADMEGAIAKREVIAMKNASALATTMAAAANAGRGALSASGGLASTTKSARAGAKPAGKAADTLTRAGLKQKAIALRRDIELKLTAVQQLEESIASQTEDAQALSTLLTERHDAVAALEMQATSVQREINTALYEKQKAVETISALARLLQRFELLEMGKMPPLTADEASRVLERLAQAEEMQRNVRKLVLRLATEHADLAEVLDRVAQLIDIAPRL